MTAMPKIPDDDFSKLEYEGWQRDAAFLRQQSPEDLQKSEVSFVFSDEVVNLTTAQGLHDHHFILRVECLQ